MTTTSSSPDAGPQAQDDDAAVLREMYGPAQGYSGKCRDDVAGQTLKDELVLQTRATEMAFFTSKNVWKKVARSRARATTGRNPISVRWGGRQQGR